MDERLDENLTSTSGVTNPAIEVFKTPELIEKMSKSSDAAFALMIASSDLSKKIRRFHSLKVGEYSVRAVQSDKAKLVSTLDKILTIVFYICDLEGIDKTKVPQMKLIISNTSSNE